MNLGWFQGSVLLPWCVVVLPLLGARWHSPDGALNQFPAGAWSRVAAKLGSAHVSQHLVRMDPAKLRYLTLWFFFSTKLRHMGGLWNGGNRPVNENSLAELVVLECFSWVFTGMWNPVEKHGLTQSDQARETTFFAMSENSALLRNSQWQSHQTGPL